MTRHTSLAFIAAGLCAATLAGTAFAGSLSSTGFTHIGPSPAGLPSCNSSEVFDACRLPVKQPTFDTLDGWAAEGDVSRGGDATGNQYAAIRGGSRLKQAVYADFGTLSKDASYVLRFRLLSESHDAPVRATLSMSNAAGVRGAKLGAITTTARHHEWTEVELLVDGKAYPAPAHVMIEIDNEGASSVVQVDDVFLVQSADTDIEG
ncbi:hypothetical protein SAMN02800694_2099 [Luteibacter sp. UNCMF331Sha3.1]|uniref:hypothetical protein n=1 Tax=Luteibacter sp. UNCMF331Sha3.1 TaxID=1502760 RepID=UPI0008ABE60A|nr:hypothetical protein [Luteibacter sp. UNCMF331Sha3.1]SEM90688.1 hypothetical protein SAMN02800694_2099 [Luteibacter sp. UNCMF331Sha3.1]